MGIANFRALFAAIHRHESSSRLKQLLYTAKRDDTAWDHVERKAIDDDIDLAQKSFEHKAATFKKLDQLDDALEDATDADWDGDLKRLTQQIVSHHKKHHKKHKNHYRNRFEEEEEEDAGDY